MAKKIWTKSINKHTDWGGDESTDNYPVAGEKVQEFIKGSLNSRFGGLWYNENLNAYFLFSDTEDKETYLSDPENNGDLVLDIISLGPKHIFVSESEWEGMTEFTENSLYFTYEEDEEIPEGEQEIYVTDQILHAKAKVQDRTLYLTGKVESQTLYI